MQYDPGTQRRALEEGEPLTPPVREPDAMKWQGPSSAPRDDNRAARRRRRRSRQHGIHGPYFVSKDGF